MVEFFRHAWKEILWDWAALDATGNSFAPIALQPLMEPLEKAAFDSAPAHLTPGPPAGSAL